MQKLWSSLLPVPVALPPRLPLLPYGENEEMNCPQCRKKLWYWGDLSRPQDGFLTYLCQNCSVVYTLDKKLELPKAFLEAWGGVRIVRMKLNKRGYEGPPVKRRGTTKASPPPDTLKSAHPSKRGGT